MALANLRAAFGLTAALTFILGACGGATPGQVSTPAATPIAAFDGLVIEMVAKSQEFSKAAIEVPAGAPFRILLDNQDANFPHGIAIAQGATAADARKATPLYEGTLGSGPALLAYDIPPLSAGTYWFFCQPHANMNGTIVVR